MKSRTSFFNATVLKKDITRFAPIWGLYSVLVGLFLLLWWEVEASPARFVNTAPDILRAMGLVNFLYAPLAAFLLFGDLFKSRMCNALHALPMRREGWFLTHFTAGMLFCVVPNGVAALICAAMLQEYAWAAFVWLAVMVLQYLFFFGVAVFAAQAVGNMLGALAVYAIVNFLAVITGWMVISFYEPLLYGVKLEFGSFAKYSPIVRFFSADFMQTHYDNATGTTVLEGFVGEDWRYLGIAAGVGAVLLGLSVLIYRKRQLENAGELISLPPVAPVFLVIYTLCAGAVLYLIASSLTPALEYIFLLAGFAIGFFTGRMLLERKVKVFGGKNFLAFGIIVAVFFASLGITSLDPMGITRYVPETENVKTVQVCTSHYKYDILRDSVTLSDPEDIKAIAQIHQSCVDNPYEERNDRVPLTITYTMKNGTTVERYYYIAQDNPGIETISGYFSSLEAIFGYVGPGYVLENIRLMEAYSYREDRPLAVIATNSNYTDMDYYVDKYVDKDNHYFYLTDTPAEDPILTGLFEALEKDCHAGNMTQNSLMQDTDLYGHLVIQYMAYQVEYLDIDIFYGCENTVAFLETLSPNPVGPAK